MQFRVFFCLGRNGGGKKGQGAIQAGLELIVPEEGGD